MSAVAAPFFVAFALSIALVPVCRHLAFRFGCVADPRADRWHGRPTALLGGVAISVSLFPAAIGGFLLYNVYPASIFMGDAGSLLIGFSVGALTLTNGRGIAARSNLLTVVAVPVLVLLIPILDTTLVTLSRWFSGRPASQGGRDHSSHRLVAIGLSERRAVTLLWGLAAVGGALGVAVDHFAYSWSALAAGV